jgi:transposase
LNRGIDYLRVGALRRHGMTASPTIDGAMTGKKFSAYVERCLAPTLKRKDIVMLDNLPAHKAAVREAIEALGHHEMHRSAKA